MAESTLREYIQSQEHLVREAGLAIPHQFAHCTYPLGSLRQAVYLCLTCPEPRGICSACSVACHTQHEQVELFPKRNFRCDCSTSAIAHACTLETTAHPPNEDNQYGQNFQGLFCRCHRTYDAQKERETMIQCLACEDWFHESCCNLRERPSSREPTPYVEVKPEQAPGALASQTANTNSQDDDEDANSEATDSDLPPPFVAASDYDSFVCGSCVRNIDILQKYAGTTGAIMVVRETSTSEWRRIGDSTKGEREDVVVEEDDIPNNTGIKRKLSPSSDEDVREPKRTRKLTNSTVAGGLPCLAPQSSSIASKIFEQLSTGNEDSGTGDLFLTDGFRERWCQCDDCRISLENHRFLIEEEETYDPPEDPDSGLSLEELGMRALARLPRDRAIDGIQAFNKMRDGLKSFLQPFAEEGKVVNEADVRNFFTEFAEAAKNGR